MLRLSMASNGSVEPEAFLIGELNHHESMDGKREKKG